MELPPLKGRVAYIFSEDNFDVDQIIGIENIKIQDLDILKEKAMKLYDKEFANLVKDGDILVGGRNFGYGHPHYPAMQVMRYMGIKGVVAESFATGYYINEINMGYPQIVCRGIMEFVDRWDNIEVIWERGEIINHSKDTSISFDMPPKEFQEKLHYGGFLNWLDLSIKNEI